MYDNVIISQVPVMTSVGLYAYAYFCHWPTLNKVENIISTKCNQLFGKVYLFC